MTKPGSFFPNVFACLLFLLAGGLGDRKVEAFPAEDSVTVLYTVAKRYEPLAWMRGGERFPAGAMIVLREISLHTPHSDSMIQRLLIPKFAATADAAVSFDGQRVLFSGKRSTQEPWQIWEIDLARGEPHQITFGHEDHVLPFYLPGDRFVCAHKVDGRFVIEAMDLMGRNPLQLTYGPSNYLPTDVLRDGRILFEAGYPLGAEIAPEIYTVYSDGTGVESHRCDHGNAHYQGRQISSGNIVFASRTGSLPFGLAEFISASAHEVHVDAPAGDYAGDIAEMPSGDWLLPWRPTQRAHFQLAAWEVGSQSLRASVADPDRDVVQPVVVAKRISPKQHPSALRDLPNADLLCLNAYTSKSNFTPGSIHSVRIYSRDTRNEPALLGTAPVERDGSFFVQVPTERALQIELLDSAGKTLKREAGFFWLRRGEQRVCVGCHAGPETAPENAVPMILLKSTTPTDVGVITSRSRSVSTH